MPVLPGPSSESSVLCPWINVHYLLYPLLDSGHQVLCWGPWSIWSWVWCKVINMDLFAFFSFFPPIYFIVYLGIFTFCIPTTLTSQSSQVCPLSHDLLPTPCWKCWLAWFCAGLEQEVKAAVSSWMRWLCYLSWREHLIALFPRPLVFTFFLPPWFRGGRVIDWESFMVCWVILPQRNYRGGVLGPNRFIVVQIAMPPSFFR